MGSVTIEINIAGPGHPLYDGKLSKAGHMWIRLPNGETRGYTPKGVTEEDGDTYKPGYFSREIELTRDQWNSVQDFIDNPRLYGFGDDKYDFARNSCVDYTWKFLEQAGWNPEGFEGKLPPRSNEPYIRDLEPFSSEYLSKPSAARSQEYQRRRMNDLYDRARGQIVEFRDPLVLDLDGDGLETVGTSAGVMFDHDASGVRRGTGWVRPDDALVVLDRDGNGTIDSGRELFGTQTLMSDGRFAAHGLEALADLDSNGDGVFDAADERYGEVML